MGYLGSKGASGAYQTIIANMPAHDVYIEAFLGTGIIANRKAPAMRAIGVEIDRDTIADFTPEHPIELINQDVLSFLREFEFDDAANTFIYADPPYLLETRTSSKRYRHEFTVAQHRELLTLFQALTLQGVKIMLSGYPNALYDDTLTEWRSHKFRVMTRGGVRTEKIWMNYEADSAHWSTYAGKNFTERQRIKRKAARWAKNFHALEEGEKIAILAAMMNTPE